MIFQRNVLIKNAGHGNYIAPSKLPHPFNVLGWFHVTDVWCEKSGLREPRYWMVRLELINLNEIPWYSVKGADLPYSLEEPDFTTKAPLYTCSSCNTESKEIFNKGWTCLQSHCENYFVFASGAKFDNNTLDYADLFLQERSLFTGQASPRGPLIPDLPTETNLGIASLEALGFEKACRRGIVCPQCHCCSRRLYWDRWLCENEQCGYIHKLRTHALTASEVITDEKNHDYVHKKDEGYVAPEIVSREYASGQYRVRRYEICGNFGQNVGFVEHYVSNEIINSQPGGPNDLFKDMQVTEMHLKKSPVRAAGSKFYRP